MGQTFERLDAPPAYKLVYEAIEREIIAGNLKPGDQLPTETVLAEQFGVNRSTVREGIRSLEQSGLVGRAGGRRLFVTLPHYKELATRGSRALVMHRITFRELWEMTMLLEPSAAEAAAQRIDATTLEKIEQNVARTRHAVEQDGSLIALDIEFHQLVAEATGNRALSLAREPVSLLFYPALKTLFNHSKTSDRAGKRLLVAHQYIFDALQAGDSEVARDWMRRHIIDFKRGYDVCGLDIDGKVDLIPID
ncbi:FadR/GntR family transcriptional regulator [Rhodovibrionaceae bacterium A322]